MRFRLGVTMVAAVGMLAMAAPPSFGAYSDPVIEKAKLTVVKKGRKPTWKVSWLLCYQGSNPLEAQVSEFSYRQGEKFRTLEVQTRGERRLEDPSNRGGVGTCSWYYSNARKSKFPQRAGYVTGVTLQVFAGGPGTTRTFRLHP